MNLASKEKVSQLTGKIDKLTRKVQNLEKKLARKAKEEAKKEADRLTKKAKAKVIPLPKDDLKPENLPETKGPETLELS